MSSQRLYYSAFVILLLINLSACAFIESITQDDELEAYAESVFRRQNSITTTIMMQYEDELPEDSQLNQAEMAMYEACKLLNEYSSREMDGEPMGVLFKRKVKASIKGCDESILKVEAILANF